MYDFYHFNPSRKMFLRKGGKATHQLGDMTRDVYEVELINVYDEEEDNWIGSFVEGFGFFHVKFAKSDCREATEEEIKQWFRNRDSVKFWIGENNYAERLRTHS